MERSPKTAWEAHRTPGIGRVHLVEPATTRTPVYETRDMHLAAYLHCRGYEFLSLRREGPLCTFTFRDRPERRDDCLAFYNGHGVVVPLKLVASIRQMKGLLHGRT